MTAIIIGILSGLLTILFIAALKRMDRNIIYGLVLSGIGFLYVGFVWTDATALIITSIQAIVFVFLAYYGVKKSLYILAAGFFLHGGWDLVYNFLATPGLVPPHYDLFCSSLDFIIGAYILVFKNQFYLTKSLAEITVQIPEPKIV